MTVEECAPCPWSTYAQILGQVHVCKNIWKAKLAVDPMLGMSSPRMKEGLSRGDHEAERGSLFSKPMQYFVSLEEGAVGSVLRRNSWWKRTRVVIGVLQGLEAHIFIAAESEVV